MSNIWCFARFALSQVKVTDDPTFLELKTPARAGIANSDRMPTTPSDRIEHDRTVTAMASPGNYLHRLDLKAKACPSVGSSHGKPRGRHSPTSPVEIGAPRTRPPQSPHSWWHGRRIGQDRCALLPSGPLLPRRVRATGSVCVEDYCRRLGGGHKRDPMHRFDLPHRLRRAKLRYEALRGLCR